MRGTYAWNLCLAPMPGTYALCLSRATRPPNHVIGVGQVVSPFPAPMLLERKPYAKFDEIGTLRSFCPALQTYSTFKLRPIYPGF